MGETIKPADASAQQRVVMANEKNATPRSPELQRALDSVTSAADGLSAALKRPDMQGWSKEAKDNRNAAIVSFLMQTEEQRNRLDAELKKGTSDAAVIFALSYVQELQERKGQEPAIKNDNRFTYGFDERRAAENKRVK